MNDQPIDDYTVLLSLFLSLGQSQVGKKIADNEGWIYDAETLSIKLFRHLLSMEIIARPTVMQVQGGAQAAHIDHASVKVLARTALETYLVFYFIYLSGDVSLSKFRHDAWHLAGLIDRQDLNARSEEDKAKMAAELDDVEAIRLRLKVSPHLQAYSAKQQNRLINGDWLIGFQWRDLGRLAGFHQKYFQNIYSYLCGYAHASYASAMQVGQARSIEDQMMLTKAILQIGLVIMAHYAKAYTKAFPDTAAVLEGEPRFKEVVDCWHIGAADMEPIWGVGEAEPEPPRR